MHVDSNCKAWEGDLQMPQKSCYRTVLLSSLSVRACPFEMWLEPVPILHGCSTSRRGRRYLCHFEMWLELVLILHWCWTSRRGRRSRCPIGMWLELVRALHRCPMFRRGWRTTKMCLSQLRGSHGFGSNLFSSCRAAFF